MQKWLIKRVGQALFTIFAVVTLSFALIRFLPGGPMDYIRGQLMSRFGQRSQQMERVNALAETYLNLRPDDPLWKQYVDYMTSTLQGDLGQSVWYDDPVTTVLADVVPWTLFVMGISTLLTFIIGIAAGALLAYHEGERLDVASTTIISFANGVPYYIVGLLLLFFLGYQTDLFPSRGRIGSGVTAGPNIEFLASAIHHAALPIISVVVTEFGGIALVMRGNSIQELGEDYLRVARLRGVPSNRIALRYVARNAILPMYTSFMIAIGFLFGGSVILEQVFGYVGVGYIMVEAINSRDYPLMMGGFLIITAAVVIGIFIADLTYGLIDPRIQTEGEDNG